MIERPDREDTTRQEAALHEAALTWFAALADLQLEAKNMCRLLPIHRQQAGRPRTEAIDQAAATLTGAMRTAERVEEAYTLAALDLRTARGEDT